MSFLYKKYDQKALDRQYNNRLQVPHYNDYYSRWKAESRKTDEKYPLIRNIAYGSGTREKLDIFPADTAGSKTLVFIHGGYWHLLDKDLFHFVAGAFREQEITVVFLSYPFAPASSLPEIVNSCRKGLAWIHENIARFNGNPEKIWIAGHSAGGHLSVMMATEPVNQEPKLNLEGIQGILAMSGIYDLLPVSLTYLNDVLNIDKTIIKQCSPVRLKPSLRCPIMLAVGRDESQEFNQQSQELYNQWKKDDIEVNILPVANANHFSIVDELAAKSGALYKVITTMMNGNLPLAENL